MTNLLHINSSPRIERSHTRRMTATFVQQWQALYPDVNIIYRDIANNPPPHITQNWIAAAFTEPSERSTQMQTDLAISDALVDELIQSNYLVLGTPMYNFGIPSTLKAYIDQIVRIGRTFLFDPENKTTPYKPLTKEKTAYILVSTGDTGYAPGEPLDKINQLEPYLRTVLTFIGIKDIHFIYQGNDEFGGEKLAHSIAQAQAKIESMLQK